MSVFDEFKWRGMVYDQTMGVDETLASRKITAYIGFDPTARSLHVGSLLPLMALARLQRYGHTPIAIAGGGTGRIGDPSGKKQERPLLDDAQIEANLVGIREQLAAFLDFDAASNPALLINNAEWLSSVAMIDFLRDVGKYFTVNYMLDKESVKRRIGSSDVEEDAQKPAEGISFTEFAYMLLQAYDYLVLFDRYGCELQLGGSDQWGNITAGIELIRKRRGATAHALVLPLVTNSAGTKFGKTEAGTIWLDPELTSPFEFYQFWLNTDDRDVDRYLKFFTWLTQEDIAGLAQRMAEAPEKREAQRALAREVTRMVHGEAGLERAEKATAALFGADLADLSAADVLVVFRDVPSASINATEFAGEGLPIVALLTQTALASSGGEARRLISGGGIYLNNRQIGDANYRVTLGDSIEGQCLVLRKGKKSYHVVRISS